jgi:hypothetical protein
MPLEAAAPGFRANEHETGSRSRTLGISRVVNLPYAYEVFLRAL